MNNLQRSLIRNQKGVFLKFLTDPEYMGQYPNNIQLLYKYIGCQKYSKVSQKEVSCFLKQSLDQIVEINPDYLSDFAFLAMISGDVEIAKKYMQQIKSLKDHWISRVRNLSLLILDSNFDDYFAEGFNVIKEAEDKEDTLYVKANLAKTLRAHGDDRYTEIFEELWCSEPCLEGLTSIIFNSEAEASKKLETLSTGDYKYAEQRMALSIYLNRWDDALEVAKSFKLDELVRKPVRAAVFKAFYHEQKYGALGRYAKYWAEREKCIEDILLLNECRIEIGYLDAAETDLHQLQIYEQYDETLTLLKIRLKIERGDFDLAAEMIADYLKIYKNSIQAEQLLQHVSDMSNLITFKNMAL